METKLSAYFLNQTGRVFLPIGIYGGLAGTDYTVAQTVTDADVQYEVSLRMHELFNTPAMLTGMDLSVEAEVFGCSIRFSEHEVPTVLGRKVSSVDEIENLATPPLGGRTRVYLDAAKRLSLIGKEKGVPVLGGMIGPFSLAGRIFGVSESMELSLTNPDELIALLNKVTPFLIQYAQAFKEAGASGVIIAEPAAGLLSPRGLGKFSSPFVKQIIEATQSEEFTIVLHNCGAKIVHLNKILEAGAEIYHFGEPMDIPAALEQVGGKVILGGNLDPSGVFASGSKENVIALTKELVEQTRRYPNYFISSGCEIPPNANSEFIQICADTVKTHFS
jgi:uroporphyrinogen decarboxylase